MPQASPFVERVRTMRNPALRERMAEMARQARIAAIEDARQAAIAARDERLQALLAPGGFPGFAALASDLSEIGYDLRVLPDPKWGEGTVFIRACKLTQWRHGGPGRPHGHPFERAVIIGHDGHTSTEPGALVVVVWPGPSRPLIAARISPSTQVADGGFKAVVFPAVTYADTFAHVAVRLNSPYRGERRDAASIRLNVDPGCWHVPESQRWPDAEPLAPRIEAIIHGMVETIEDPLTLGPAPSYPERLGAWARGIAGRLLDRAYAPAPQ